MSSVELLGLILIVEWAKAVRVVRGRLVPVKKAAALLERPAELWMGGWAWSTPASSNRPPSTSSW